MLEGSQLGPTLKVSSRLFLVWQVRVSCRWDRSQDLPIAKLTPYQLSYDRSVIIYSIHITAWHLWPNHALV